MPLNLPCGHTLCLTCCKGQLQKKSDNKAILECGECRRSTELECIQDDKGEENWFSNLHKVFQLLSYVEQLKTIENKNNLLKLDNSECLFLSTNGIPPAKQNQQQMKDKIGSIPK